MIKVIFSDLDNTLALGTNISGKCIKAIDMYTNLNGLFIIISGRSISYLRKITSNIDSIRYIIGNNGSIIYDKRVNKVIYSNLIEYNDILSIYNLFKEFDVKILLSGISYDYVNKSPVYNQVLFDKIDKNLYDNNFITQIVIESNKKDVILDVINLVNKMDCVKVINRSRMLYDDNYKCNNYWVNIGKDNTNKGIGVKKMCKYLNINLSDTLRVGDDLNDLSMFLDEGKNIAVANSYKDVIEKADEITLSCVDDGIYYLIKNMIKDR